MRISVVGCNHRTAPVEVREQLAFNDKQIAEALLAFKERYPQSEALILSTCNRTELYVARPLHGAPRLPEAIAWLIEQRRIAPESLSEHLYHHEQSDAVEHLFRVVSSLDSMVVGESEILGQTKRALALADTQKSVGSLLRPLFSQSFAVAKEVHTDTAISEGHVSVGSVALDFAGRLFSQFGDKTVLMIGAGQMGELTLTHLLTKTPGQVWVTNRTSARAEELSRRLNATAKPFDRLEELVAEADIVIASIAASEPLLTVDKLRDVPSRRKFRPLLLLDLGIPRNIEPGLNELENVYVYNIDDLQRISDEQWQRRRADIAHGERLIAAGVAEYFKDRARREIGPVIAALSSHLHDIMDRECARALPKLKTAADADREVVEQMVHRVVHKVLHTPIRVLNSKAGQGKAQLYADTLTRLFELPEED